jgi:hypothetical protein
MTNPSKRTSANQANALQSTGPRTANGRARSSQNALQHGVLSAKLVLPGESLDEYHALLQSLMTELAPVGTLEQLLVERIAVAIWRQRRLVGAESAAVTEAQLATGLLTMNRIMAITGLPFTERDWVSMVLQDLPLAESLHAMQLELDQISGSVVPDLAAIRQHNPNVWKSLCQDCDVFDHMSPSEQLEQAQMELTQTHGSLASWLEAEYAQNAKLLRVIQAATTVREAQAMPSQSDQLARYQAALDNEWYKSMRTLRDAQKFRQEQAALNATPLPAS